MSAPIVNTFIGSDQVKCNETMMTESINLLMAELHKGDSNLFAFQSLFGRLIQTTGDPPFEILCLYLATSYHISKSIFIEPLLVADELFQLSISFSTPCNALKRVAILAPVIYVLHKSFIGLSKENVPLGRRIENLLERIVNHISISFYLEEPSKEIDKLVGSCFLDMMRVWTVDQVEGSCEVVDNLRLFFPLLSDDVRLQINASCRMDYLVGVVMTEVFILILQLKLGLGVLEKPLQRDVGAWAVQTVREFKNFIFYDILLKMMLELSLPVTTLLSYGEEVLLRKVLYDAVLLGEFPFLRSGRFTQLNGDQLKNSYLVWLLVADNAIEFVREYELGEHAAIYIEAFSRSDIPNLLIGLVSNQIGMGEKLSGPDTPTPKALIKWLLDFEDVGFRIFEDGSTLHAKATVCNSKQDYVLPIPKPAFPNSDPNSFFNSSNKLNGAISVCGEQEMVHSSHNPIASSDCAVTLTVAHGRRKREEEMNEEARWPKIVKYNFHNTPVTGFPLPLPTDNLISGSQRNPAPNGLCTGIESGNTAPDDADEDMEDA